MGKLFVMVVRISIYIKRKIIFWKNDFSLLKSLHEKHRFVKFLGLERGGPTNGFKLILPNVFWCLRKTNLLMPTSVSFINMEDHLSFF